MLFVVLMLCSCQLWVRAGWYIDTRLLRRRDVSVARLFYVLFSEENVPVLGIVQNKVVPLASVHR